MRNLLRIAGLTTIVTAAALSGALAAVATGSCRTTCFSSTPPFGTQVTWSTSYAGCCSGTINPCPPGTVPGPAYYTPPVGGESQRCPL